MSNEFKERIKQEAIDPEEEKMRKQEDELIRLLEEHANAERQKEERAQKNHKTKRDFKNDKRTLKGRFKNFGNKVKEIANSKVIKILIKVGSVILAGLLLGTAYTKGKEYVDNYKENAFASSLNTVKEELGADAIYNKSYMTSSISGIVWYEVIKDGKSYEYKAHMQDGEIDYVLRNDGIDVQTRGAIDDVSAAQNGNIWDAKRANKLVEDVKSGEKNLIIDNKDYLEDRLADYETDEMEIG